MKETQFTPQDEVKFEIAAQHQKKLNHLSRRPIKKGHSIYEFNFQQNTIKKLVFEEDKVIHFNRKKQPKKIIIQDKCLYIPALNMKNAIRHIHNKFNPNITPKIIE